MPKEPFVRPLYPKGANGAWMLLFSIVTVIAAAVGTLAARPPAAPRQGPAAAQRRMDQALTSPYERWLNEEVVYIIDDKERAAFQKLTTDAEGRKFVVQFWERRNPNPGSPENDFKLEHYRRIAYVNEHFAASRPGWQTDRGRMYIVYGPPDEIVHKDYRGGAHPQFAAEIWTYRHLQGVGDNASVTFVDRTGTGDYQLAPGSAQ